MSKNVHRIAVIPGDGIGKEVVPEGLRVLEAVSRKYGCGFAFDHFDFASCDYYREHGTMMPDNWKSLIGRHDAIFFGAVGWPETVPDHVSLWGSLIQFRREFDQYVNLRPVKLMPGVPSPLAGRVPGDIDFYVVRENTEGEYSSIGGKIFPDSDREVVIQETVMTRVGVDRILRFAFDLAQRREKKHLTSATKSNGISITMPYWDERVEAMASSYPDVRWDKYHIDILTAHFVQHPNWFDVVVASNLLAIFCPISAPPARARSGLRPPATSIPNGASLRCSSRSTGPRRILPGRALPIPSGRSGPLR
jgi:tartrate dehydrogenase/decarboxylase/D-malate dehydrogenase